MQTLELYSWIDEWDEQPGSDALQCHGRIPVDVGQRLQGWVCRNDGGLLENQHCQNEFEPGKLELNMLGMCTREKVYPEQ